MELYRDYSYKKIADDYYLVFEETKQPHQEIGGFTHKEIFIYPKYKGMGLGYVITTFMKEVYKNNKRL